MVGYQRAPTTAGTSVRQRALAPNAMPNGSPASKHSSVDTDDSDDSDSEFASIELGHGSIHHHHYDDDNNNYNGRQTFAVQRNTNTTTAASAANAKKGNGGTVQRMPTRRPNPSIHNRNALMARENRKKKKQHVETLERDVSELRDENDALRKLLRKRSTMVTKLRDERLYLKSIIANKTSIMAMLQTIQGNRLPITSSTMDFLVEHANDDKQATVQRQPEQQQQHQQPSHTYHERTSAPAMEECSSSGCSSVRTTDSEFGTTQPTRPADRLTYPATSLTPSTASPLPSLSPFLFSDYDLDLTPDMDAFESSAATQVSHDASVSPVDGFELPALPWDDAVIDDHVEFTSLAYQPVAVGADVDMSVTDRLNEDSEEEEEDDDVDEEEEEDVNEDNDEEQEDGDEQRPHQFKVSHEHNYSNNLTNEQLRTPLRNRCATARTAAAADSSCSTTAAQHMHLGGKVRPSAYALKPSAQPGPGICLHLSGGRVSLEFCVSCHRHARNAWDEAAGQEAEL